MNGCTVPCQVCSCSWRLALGPVSLPAGHWDASIYINKKLGHSQWPRQFSKSRISNKKKMILYTVVYILVQIEASGQINLRQIQSAETPMTTVVNLGNRGPSVSSLSMAFFFFLSFKI